MNWALANQTYRNSKGRRIRVAQIFPLKDLAFLLGVSFCVLALIATGH